MALSALRLLLAVAYPLLAHWASHAGGPPVAALALADLIVLVLLQPRSRPAAWAWLLLLAALAGLWLQRDADWLRMALLAPPPLFTGLIAWLFARSLRAPRVPVISKIVAGLQQCDPAQLDPALQRYTRRLTAAWALVLALLTAATITLALVAVPDGVLVRLGHPPVIEVSRQAWSWFANLCDYGIVGGFFVAEYALRRRWFPDQPYRNFLDFLRRMGELGPQFWRRLFD